MRAFQVTSAALVLEILLLTLVLIVAT